jgi:hypothetical protein
MPLEKHISGYELFARYLPAILTSMPFLLLGYFLLQTKETKDLLSFLLGLKFFGYISFSFIVLYFYAQLIRSTSKFFEKRYFQNQKGFPTTYFMLYSDTEYSEAFKDAYRWRVKKEFAFTLLGKSEEEATPMEAMRRLNDVTKLIILRLDGGALLGKHNQWYGFIRNLIGGSIYGFFASAINFVIGQYVIRNVVLTFLSLCLALVYGVLFLMRKQLIIQHAEAYARQLHAEFMNRCKFSHQLIAPKASSRCQ